MMSSPRSGAEVAIFDAGAARRSSVVQGAAR